MSDRVLKTIDDPQGGRRVEIYQRANGTFGFEEWTYGVDENAWYPSGHYSYAVIDTLQKAEQEARAKEARFRLRVCRLTDSLDTRFDPLLRESDEIVKILGNVVHNALRRRAAEAASPP